MMAAVLLLSEQSLSYAAEGRAAEEAVQKEPDSEETPGSEREELEGQVSGNAQPEEPVMDSESGVEMEAQPLRSMEELSFSEIEGQVFTGEAITPAVTVTNQEGTVLQEGVHYRLSYENNRNAGQASVIAAGIEEGGYTGEKKLFFTIAPRSIEDAQFELAEVWEYTGKNLPVLPGEVRAGGVVLVKDQDFTVKYRSASGNETQNVKEAGEYTFLLVGQGNYTGSVERAFRITKNKNMEAMTVKAIPAQTYTGKAIVPKVTVIDETGSQKATLKENKHYKLKYSKNKAAGTATVKITGIEANGYEGSKTVKFKIRPMNIAKFTFEDIKKCTYRKAAGLDLKVKWGSRTLKKGKDYEVSFQNGIKIGKNTVVIKGIGNYTGKKKKSVTVSFSEEDQVKLSSCKASSYRAAERKVTVRLKTNSTSTLKKMGGAAFYIAKMDSAGTKIQKKVKAQLSGASVKADFKDSDGSLMMSRYALAVKIGGKYKLLSKNSLFIENPELIAVMKEPYNGYYEAEGKVTSKKGLQGASEDYMEDLGVQHVLLNLDLADMVSTKPKSGYVRYKYKGKNYYFQDMIAFVQTMRYLNGWDDENPFGWHRRSVTVVLLLSWKDSLSYLIHPSARKKGAAPYYALNMKEKKARETFEALFCYMGEKLGDNKKSRACNWVLGNEANSCRAWNYSGSLDLEACVENYAEAFQLLYQGVKRTASTSRVFISLDHCWTASEAGHGGKEYLDEFAAYMHTAAPKMQWNVDYHPYSQPLTRTDFWNDGRNTTNSDKTPYISMKNVKVLTNYLGRLETKYKMGKGNIRVILGEQGFSAVRGRDSAEKNQAAALGYGFYLATFNSRIDAYIIRSYLDDPAEEKTGLYLGLMSSSHKKKKAYDVYKYVDTERSTEYMDPYLSTIGIKSWKKAVPGFNKKELSIKDF